MLVTAAQVTCSQSGSCAVAASFDSQSNSSHKSDFSSGMSWSFGKRVASHELYPAANVAPNLELVVTQRFGNVVGVRRGSSYGPCASGTLPIAEAPCEPGAIATDPDGAAASDSDSSVRGPLDLTSEVVVCPPSQCLSKGCSLLELRKHYFAVKGLQGCGIDTAAAEGTKFTVSSL
jgi:hypothetical protein